MSSSTPPPSEAPDPPDGAESPSDDGESVRVTPLLIVLGLLALLLGVGGGFVLSMSSLFK
ncbi:MAG TPA: hypothetical protein VLC09_12410 [Polyangiaceae bacterium]|nr:hypothetical protein [Polyangiaceae bacterium]